MKETENSLRVLHAETIKEKSKAETVFLCAVVALAGGGFSAMVAGAFPEVRGILTLALISAVLSAVFVLLSGKKVGKYLPLAVIFLCAALYALPFPQIKEGTAFLANGFLDFLTAKNGRIYLDFMAGNDALPELVLALLFIIAVLLLSMSVAEKNIFFALPVFVLSAAGILSGFLSTGISFLIFAAGSAAAAVYIFLPKSGSRPKAVSCAAFLLICCVAAVGITILVNPACDGSLQKKAENALHAALYDNKTNSMPEGELSDLGAWEKSDEAALEITLDEPQKLYIKGFVGEIYTEEGWEELPKEELAQYEDEFYWLHENGFFAQTEIVSALSALNDEKICAMTVKNVSACKERLFLPYALVGSEILDKEVIGDTGAKAHGDEYSVSYVPGGLAEWYLAQAELSSEQEENSHVKEYLSNEYAYREFVYENYIDIPVEAYDALESCLNGSEADSFSEIINAIISYLSENITYDEETVTKNGSEDFVEYFLQKSCRGYSVHYATAATLMLRYFGIPARYAEGYFLSAAEAQKYGSEDTIILDENHAHAWAEYYLDGIGWVPFETTPGYMDDELEKAAFAISGETSKIYAQNDKPKTNVEQEKEKSKVKEVISGLKMLPGIFAVVAALALLAIFIYIAAMRKRLKNALKKIDGAENKDAIAMRFGYAEALQLRLGATKEELMPLGYRQAAEINNEALFSEHPMTFEQRSVVDAYSERLLEHCKSGWNIWQRLWNRWVKCIYLK